MSQITENVILSFKNKLENHPVYEAVDTLEHLRIFMEHHVYSVWDFMSLIKYLQNAVASTQVPWVPAGDGDVRRFINELVLEEESDEVAPELKGEAGNSFTSHFELYLGAMEEIGANVQSPRNFIEAVTQIGVEKALQHEYVPEPSRTFTQQTFAFIAGNKPHEVAAALALGREHIIPCMFRGFLKHVGVNEKMAPTFHYYLNRHIHLDEDFHAPLSLRLLNGLCGDDKTRQAEAIHAAEQAVEARVTFWDGVLEAIHS